MTPSTSHIDVGEADRLMVVRAAGSAGSLVTAGALSELAALWERLATEERVLAIVVVLGTGAEEVPPVSPARDLPAGADALAGTPHVTIAALEADCFDAELALAIACDLRIVRSDARLGFPGVAAGAIPDESAVHRLTSMIGRSRSSDLLLTGRTVDGATAAEWGLAEAAAAGVDPVGRATAVARLICDGAPLAMRYAKEAVDRGYRMGLDDGLGLEGDLYAILQTTADRVEGVRAFHERRSPRFTGR